MTHFKKVLIANRGEIACRIHKTLKAMGIQSVAVYSDADSNVKFVRECDEAYRLGPAPSLESYLRGDKIIEIARQHQVCAIHPGYGFLSENADFAEAVIRSGIAFIGPRPETLRLMGDKLTARECALQAGVPVAPGTKSPMIHSSEALEIAEYCGFPILLKPAAGGGGKGMHVVHRKEDLEEAFLKAQREALSSFKDDRIFVEKYLYHPRHIEVQILGDRHGNLIHLGERECSLQRRHQKVIEEAPSPSLPPETRENLLECALKLGKSIGYESAGTLEFLLDQENNFYFLEMNTRLQVEHGVTEMITGVDLVQEMIRVAQGMPISLTSSPIPKGHSIEARIYGEDPSQDFMPSSGFLTEVTPPALLEYLRLDSGVEEGDTLTPFYDPMIAKLMSWGENRESARTRLMTALDKFRIRGISNNLGFLKGLLKHPMVVKGDLHTSLIEDYLKTLLQDEISEQEIAVIGLSIYSDLPAPIYPSNTPMGVLINQKGYLRDGEADISGKWDGVRGLWKGTVRGISRILQGDFDGEAFTLWYEGSSWTLRFMPSSQLKLAESMPLGDKGGHNGIIPSPIGGQVLNIPIKIGQPIQSGGNLLIIEAMKMENTIKSKGAGLIEEIYVESGDLITPGQPLVKISPLK